MLRSKTFPVLIAFIIFFPCYASSANNYLGSWLDNGSGVSRIGNLTITDNKISIANLVSYTVTLTHTENANEIYKVNKINTKTDPLGCGPDNKVNYIIIKPLTDIAGTQQKAIRLVFYGLLNVPKIKELDDDPAVCAVYSFGR